MYRDLLGQGTLEDVSDGAGVISMEKRDWCGPLLFLGLAGLLLSVIGALWFGGSTPSKLEQRIEEAAREKLASNDFAWVGVEAVGQKVVLSGIAPSDDAKTAAKATALKAIGSGGVFSGGVTKVIDRMDVGAVVSPYIWSAAKTDGRLYLEGYAPRRDDIERIVAAAQNAYPGKVVNNLKLGVGAPEGASWADVAIFGMSQLDGLDSGKASLKDTLLVIEGASDDQSVADDIATSLAGVSDPFQTKTSIKGPFHWAARFTDEQLVLEGQTPDEESRQLVVRSAQRAFSGTVVDRLTIGGDKGWVSSAALGLMHFGKFNNGLMVFADDVFHFKGEAAESVYEYLQEDMQGISDPYSVKYDINLVAPELEEIEGIDLSATDVDLKEEACQDAFLRIMSANQIYFKTAQAAISRESGATLDKLITVARQCAELDLLVEGHTDNRGSRAMNIRLSQRRAQAVVNYLNRKGLEIERLRAVGYGPDRPADTNTTPEGRANNRRIEFKVSN